MTGDLRTNLKLEAGRMTCHGSLDIELTATGDLALTESTEESFIQHLILWLGTPRGEAGSGSVLYDYLHEKLSKTTAAELEVALQRDLAESIPEAPEIESVRCTISSPNRMLVSIKLAGATYDITPDLADLAKISNLIAEAFISR